MDAGRWRERAWTVAAVLALCACGPQGFPGEDGDIYFESNMDHGLSRWTPATSVARGTTISFCVEQVQPIDGEFVIDAGVLTGFDGSLSGVCMEGIADDPAPIAVRFFGDETLTDHSVEPPLEVTQPIDDRFTVTTAVVAGALLADPEPLGPQMLSNPVEIPPASPWPLIGDTLYLAPGPPLALDIILLDATGASLGFSSGDVDITSDDPAVSLTRSGPFAHVTAAAGSEGTATVLRFTFRGTEVGTYPVEITDPADVVDLRLHADSLGNAPFLKATALLANGEPLMQAPIAWDYGDLTVIDWEPVCQYVTEICDADLQLQRTDILVVAPEIPTIALEVETELAVTRTITARLGTFAVQTVVEATEVGTRPAPPVPIEPPLGHGCSDGDPSWLAGLLGLMALAALRRDRRLPPTTAAG